MDLTIKNSPGKYQPIWERCLPLLSQCRPGDDIHAKETAEFILNYQGSLKFDPDVLVPTGMMHDIGHSAILDEHFKYVTGPEKIKNGKLVHMLVGAKIAKDILSEVGYGAEKTAEIVDIISMHDADSLEGVSRKEAYNTDHKKFFHDVDVLGRYSPERHKKLIGTYSENQLQKILQEHLALFFYDEFRELAKKRLA